MKLESRWWQALAVLAFVLLFWGFQFAFRGYWEPDEARFVYVAREMVASDSPFVPLRNGEIYAHKPPLMMWLITAGETLMGTPFGSRLPVVIGLFLSLFSFFSISRRLAGRETALLSVLLLSTSGDFWFSMGRGQIDPLLTGLVLSAVASFPFDRRGTVAFRDMVVPALFAGFAVFAKGPVGLVLPVLILAALLWPFRGKRETKVVPCHIAGAVAVALSIPLLWLGAAALAGAPAAYFKEIVFSQTVSRAAGGYGHSKPFLYYLQVFPLGFMPWFILLPSAAVVLWRKNRELLFRCALWILLVILFFSLSKSKRSVYILTAYPAAALMLGSAASELLNSKFQKCFSRIIAILFPVVLTGAGLCLLFSQRMLRIFPGDVDGAAIFRKMAVAMFACAAVALLFDLAVLFRKISARGICLPLSLMLVAFFFAGSFCLPLLDPVKVPVGVKEVAAKYLPEDEPLLLYDMLGESLALHAERRGKRLETDAEMLREMYARGRGLVLFSKKRMENFNERFPLQKTETGEFSLGKKTIVWIAFDTGGLPMPEIPEEAGDEE